MWEPEASWISVHLHVLKLSISSLLLRLSKLNVKTILIVWCSLLYCCMFSYYNIKCTIYSDKALPSTNIFAHLLWSLYKMWNHVKWNVKKNPIKALFPNFNLCLNVMLDSLSCSLTSIYFLANEIYYCLFGFFIAEKGFQKSIKTYCRGKGYYNRRLSMAGFASSQFWWEQLESYLWGIHYWWKMGDYCSTLCRGHTVSCLV